MALSPEASYRLLWTERLQTPTLTSSPYKHLQSISLMSFADIAKALVLVYMSSWTWQIGKLAGLMSFDDGAFASF